MRLPSKREQDAQSPVIGVILLVGVTIILAVVIATFVLDIGERADNSPPQASFDFEESTQTFDDDDGDKIELIMITVTHESGDTIDATNLQIQVNGEPAYGLQPDPGPGERPDPVELWKSGTVSSGDSVQLAFATEKDVKAGDRVSTGGDGNDPNTKVRLVNTEIEPGDTIRVVYSEEGTGSSAVIGKYEVVGPGNQF